MNDASSSGASAAEAAPAPAACRALLARLPRSERHAALTEQVAAEFRAVLQMMPHEALPDDESFFDLGLTSLSVEEVKQRLETSLACRVDAEVLFNHPTLGHLIAHLESGPLAELFEPGAAHAGATGAAPAGAPHAEADEKSLVDDMLARLYQP